MRHGFLCNYIQKTIIITVVNQLELMLRHIFTNEDLFDIKFLCTAKHWPVEA